jgi:hypothetical protein
MWANKTNFFIDEKYLYLSLAFVVGMRCRTCAASRDCRAKLSIEATIPRIAPFSGAMFP